MSRLYLTGHLNQAYLCITSALSAASETWNCWNDPSQALDNPKMELVLSCWEGVTAHLGGFQLLLSLCPSCAHPVPIPMAMPCCCAHAHPVPIPMALPCPCGHAHPIPSLWPQYRRAPKVPALSVLLSCRRFFFQEDTSWSDWETLLNRSL